MGEGLRLQISVSHPDVEASKEVLEDGVKQGNDKVWKQKCLVGRAGGSGAVSLSQGRVRGDPSMGAALIWGLVLSLLH